MSDKKPALWMGLLYIFNYTTPRVTLNIYPVSCFNFYHLIMTGLYRGDSMYSG